MEPSAKKYVVIALIIAILLVLGAIVYIYFSYIRAPSSLSGYDASAPTVPITYANFQEAMASNPMIKAIPENSEILLNFYNYNSGEKQIEKSYILKSDGISEGALPSPQITLQLHSKYMDGLTNKNFCTMINQANAAGDLSFESSLSNLDLAWKFKSMYAYRDCLGF